MSAHTPGPWKFGDFIHNGDPSDDEAVVYLSNDEEVIVEGLNAAANACLIAAAPDMLEALRAVVAVADRKTHEFDLARAAIAKAFGLDKERDKT